MDLVRDGGGEASGDGQLLVGQQGILRFALEGDIAEDHDDAGDSIGAVADGGAAVCDVQLGLVFADEDGVVAEADDAVEALDLGDGIFDRFPGCLIDDVEDGLERLAVGFGLRPPGEFHGDRVHHLDEAFGVAGDDAVADGGEGGAELLLGLEDLFGAAAEDIERSFVGVGDGVETVAGEQADEDADAESEHKQELLHAANLMLPEVDSCRAALLGVMGGIGEVAADIIHHGLAAQVQIDVAHLAAGLNGGDDGESKGVEPDLVLFGEIVDVALFDLIEAGERSHLVELGLQAGGGIEIGLEKARVGGVLVSAQRGLLVKDEGVDTADLGDVGIGFLDEPDGRIGSLNLQVQRHRRQEERDDRQ